MAVVAVSAGHYAEKPGAIYHTHSEYEVATQWQLLLCKHLEENDVRSVFISPGKLHRKVYEINHVPGKCDLALEIHFNSDPGRAGKGSETLYYPGSVNGEAWAERIQRAISTFCAPNRGAKEGWYRMDKPGHIDYKGDVEGDEIADFFLRKTNCTALILEPYFLHEWSRIEANGEIVCAVIAEAVRDGFAEE